MTRFLLLLALVPLAWPPHAGAQVAGARTIEIQVGDNMRFTPARIDARPGEQLHVVLKDTGTMPKVAMAHNFVLLKKGADPKAFAEKSAAARDTDYVAPAVKAQVLAATKLVGPGETADVTFAAPAQGGDYTFICSFPGHFVVGMRGSLVVSARDLAREP
jgi:azurin